MAAVNPPGPPPTIRQSSLPVISPRPLNGCASPSTGLGGAAFPDIPLLPRQLPLQLAAAAVQDELGVAVRLLAALEHQVAGRLEGDAAVEVRRHRPCRPDRRRSGGRPPRPCASCVSTHLRLGARCRGAASWRCAGWRCAAWRGPPSGRHRGCPAPWSSRRPGRSSARRSRGCPGRCCPAPAARRPAPSWAGRPAGWSGCRPACRAAAAGQLVLPAPPRRPRGSAARAAWRRWARAPRRCWRRPCGWPIFCSSIVGHPVGHRPHALADLGAAAQAAGQADIDVAVLVGLDPGGSPSCRPCGPSAPASMEVWISSPVRSRKPVLMKTTRSLAARMQALRLTVVRRSSSMMPILRVLRGRPRASSTRPNSVVGEGHLLRPVHLRLDDVDASRRGCCAGALPLAGRAARSATVHSASRMAFRRSRLPSVSVTASVIMWWPTLRTSIRLRPGRVSVAAVRRRVGAVGVQPARRSCLPPFSKLAAERAVHQAEPVAVDVDLVLGIHGGDAVLAVHDGGERRLPARTSATPAGSSLPMEWSRSIRISRCRPLLTSRIGGRRAGVARIADALGRVARGRCCRHPSASPTSLPPSMA